MNLVESVRIALRALAANKMRSALTMLGIIIGVAAVIALMGVGSGAQVAVDSQISSMGTNLLFVTPGATSQGGVRSAQGSVQTLTYQDAQALVDPVNASAIAAVAPEMDTTAQVVFMSNNANTRVLGVTPAYGPVRDYVVQDGNFLTQADVDDRSSVAIVGANVASELFTSGQEPVGQSIRINNTSFQIIGVLVAKGGSGFANQDDQVLVPITTAQARLQRNQTSSGNTVTEISVEVTSQSQMQLATLEITSILEQRHHILTTDDFTIQSQDALLSSANSVTGILTIFLGGVAGISLLVGGIGIMNIMLVSVTERTREIGIRMAIGATRGNVLSQFLTEATILSVLGGLTGVALGVGIAHFVSGINMGSTPIHAVVSAGSILMATGFALAIGLFFGIYPAYRAASLKPIDALHYE
jgi:putative ABC transport system permease protein